MPWGVQRLNVKKSQPNANIVFIKPLSGPNEKIAQDFLERIAAQCRTSTPPPRLLPRESRANLSIFVTFTVPVMREHHLYVMSLEEFPPNREFVGRNFNAGEVIQLVLRSPGSGRWLPFEYVQMVMMHELAHCKQMNHSRAFWAVRNNYATQMRGLWGKGYTGEGIWGRGATLSTGRWEKDTVRDGELLPEHLCGGTFRSRRRGKRGRKQQPTLSYQERKQRRIEKKFGKHGVALGADDEAKVKLEKGKKVQAKPRVAGSARGRELRAAAALARFDEKKEEVKQETKQEVKDEDETASGSDSDYDDVADWPDLDTKDAVDVDGTRLVDEKGRGMVKVCEDEAQDDPGAQNEMQELQNVFRRVKEESPGASAADISVIPQTSVKEEFDPGSPTLEAVPAATSTTSKKPSIKEDLARSTDLSSIPVAPGSDSEGRNEKVSSTRSDSAVAGAHKEASFSCSMCSFVNPSSTVTCGVCANVLDPVASPDCWRCVNETCKDTLYRNSGDCGVCGLCGVQRSAKS